MNFHFTFLFYDLAQVYVEIISVTIDNIALECKIVCCRAIEDIILSNRLMLCHKCLFRLWFLK